MVRLITFIILLLSSGCDSKRNGMSGKEFRKAQVLYTSNCSYCHGESGYGDGLSASSFDPPPRNFHLPTENWVNGKTESGIEKTLKEGIQPNMWAYKGKEEDIRLLSKYVYFLGSAEIYNIEDKK